MFETQIINERCYNILSILVQLCAKQRCVIFWWVMKIYEILRYFGVNQRFFLVIWGVIFTYNLFNSYLNGIYATSGL